MPDNLTLKFDVHNVSIVPRNVKVQHKGALADATIECVEVELVAHDRSHSSVTLRFDGQDAELAKEKFKADGVVSWTL